MAGRLLGLVLAFTLPAACAKTEPPSVADAGARRPPSTPAATPVKVEPPLAPDPSFQLPAVERIVAIGDVHGDVSALRAALRLASAIDEAGKWIGKNLVVVQTGDQLDRGDDEPQIIDLLARLRDEAKSAGGAVHALNGNHEVMNVQADFRYVTPDGFHDFSGGHPDALHQQLTANVPLEQRGRAAAFLPGGEVARRLSVQPIVIQIGGNVFVHGGVLEQHVRYGLGRMNRETSAWMAGAPSESAPAGIASERAPIWVRDYSEGTPSAERCAELSRVLHALSGTRMIVGHTVQRQGINSACDGKVWRIDVGLSRFYGAKPSVLEIRGDSVRVVSLVGSAAPAPLE
ncbi:MAG TPA: metallophosphoesterase [Polyangiaceae bacterium]|nr:metallophosphoesterase [Polyangiaceae bacterium]